MSARVWGGPNCHPHLHEALAYCAWGIYRALGARYIQPKLLQHCISCKSQLPFSVYLANNVYIRVGPPCLHTGNIMAS